MRHSSRLSALLAAASIMAVSGVVMPDDLKQLGPPPDDRRNQESIERLNKAEKKRARKAAHRAKLAARELP